MNWRERYAEAYRKHHASKYPAAMATGYFMPKFPRVTKANGLTTLIENYLLWSGWRATRVSSAGRVVNGRYIPGRTRKGTADISSTIKGRSVMWEVKVGRDRPSKEQFEEQAREIAAGGLYYFVSTPEQFFQILDTL